MNLKYELRKLFYHIVYDPLYSLFYSLKETVMDAVSVLEEFKNPKTWSALLYIVCFYAILKRDFTLFKWLVPSIIVVYVIRQRIDGAYRKEIKEKALLKNNEIILEEEYKKYQRECYFTKKEAMGLEQWKEFEIKKMNKK